MSMLLPINLIIIKIIISVECAPKLGHILFDPLKFETIESDGNFRATNIEKSSTKLIDDTHRLNREIVMQKHIFNNNATENNSSESLRIETEFEPENQSINNTTSEYIIEQQPSEFDGSSSSEWLDPENQSREINTNIEIPNLPCSSCISHKKKNNNTELNLEPDVVLNEQNSNSSIIITSIRNGQKRSGKRREIFTPQKILMNILRNGNDTQQKQQLFGGYDYDINACRYLGDRYLCGYNKNTNMLKDEEVIEELGNGCRMRGDRMECGYINGPFDHTGNGRINTKKTRGTAVQGNNTSKPEQTKNKNESEVSKMACFEENERIVCQNTPGT